MAFWNSYLPPSAEERGPIDVEPAEPQSGISGLKSLVQSVKGEAERNAIATALEQARWNRKAAARLLKVSYRTLLYKIEQYHMSPPGRSLFRLRKWRNDRGSATSTKDRRLEILLVEAGGKEQSKHVMYLNQAQRLRRDSTTKSRI